MFDAWHDWKENYVHEYNKWEELNVTPSNW